MNVLLSPELEQYIHQQVSAGAYESPSEVVSEGIRLLEEERRSQGERRVQVRKMIEQGLAELNAGFGLPGDEVYQALKRRSAVYAHSSPNP